MKFCPGCGASLDDSTAFCNNCGKPLNGTPRTAPNFGGPNAQAPYGYAPVYQDPFDHTAEFDPKDISDNKVICMLIYLTGAIGIFIALLASNSSKYVAFHVRQALKFMVVNSLIAVVTALTFWTVLVPIAAGIFTIVLVVVQIICFFDICKGKAKEPYIIRDMKFMK
jgi:uncharacterized membrane protein